MTYPIKLLASKYIKYDDSMFLLEFFIYLLFDLEYVRIAWLSPPLVPFLTINSISISVNNSDSIFVFFKYACHANPCVDKKWAGSSSHSLRHIFLKLSNTSARKMCHIEHTNHYTHQDVLFQMFPILF